MLLVDDQRPQPGGEALEHVGADTILEWPLAGEIDRGPARPFELDLTKQSSALSEPNEKPEDDVEDVQRVPQRYLNRRRGAVSAEATGGFNVRYTNCAPPVNTDISEAHLRMLVQCLKDCYFLRGESYQTLETVARTMHIERYRQGDIIIKEGDLGGSGFVLLSGTAEVLSRLDEGFSEGDTKPEGQRCVPLEINAGVFFGENGMLWGRRRLMTIRAKSPLVVGKLLRNDFFECTTRQAMARRSSQHACVRKCKSFECLSDEQIAKLVDCLEEHTFRQGDVVIQQGGLDRDMYIVVSGECEAIICTGEDDKQVHRRYRAGDRFGELGFHTGQPRKATIVVTSHEAVLLRLGVRRAERMVGEMEVLNHEQYLLDPRKTIADFFKPCSVDPRTAGGIFGGREAKWFAVYRPTSREAIAKMLDRTAVGKGLNVKGKSATRNILSGFVPFLQISLNSDKGKVEASPRLARIRLFFQSAWGRDSAMRHMMPLLDPSVKLDIPTESLVPGVNVGIVTDTRFDNQGLFGLDVPERVLRKLYIDDQDISTRAGWETGRQSEPAFMDMNLQALRERSPSTVETVLYQFDQSNPLNPHGLLMAYAEASVKPVVSDFDTFTVGSTGGAVKYQELPAEQQALAAWSLDKTADVLRGGSREGWNSQWLRILIHAKNTGFHPAMPTYGFGDTTSYRLMSEIVQATKETGAIRHGAECFNFLFPQELDPEYLVVWEGFPDKPYAYQKEAELRQFLKTMASEGYAFPINPVWAVRDRGWYEIFTLLQQKHSREMAAWMPPQSGIADRITAINADFPGASISLRRAIMLADGEAALGDEAAGEDMSPHSLASPTSPTAGEAGEAGMYFFDHDRDDMSALARAIFVQRRWRAAKDMIVFSRRIRQIATARTQRPKPATPRIPADGECSGAAEVTS